MRKLPKDWCIDNVLDTSVGVALTVWLVLILSIVLPGCSMLLEKAPVPVASSSTSTANVATADNIEEIVTNNETINETTNETIIEGGLAPWWWLLIGMLLPMPKFMRVIF